MDDLVTKAASHPSLCPSALPPQQGEGRHDSSGELGADGVQGLGLDFLLGISELSPDHVPGNPSDSR